MKKLLFAITGLLSMMLWAQADFRPGYIITLDNDTLHGDIDYRGSSLMTRICTFRLADTHEETEYIPGTIACYRFVDSKLFVSKQVDGRPMFLEMLVKGKLNVYYSKDADGEHYYVERDDMPLREVPFTEEEVEVDGRIYTRHTSHYGILNYYTQDVPRLQTDIKRMKTLSPQGMIGLAQKYHHLACDDHSCVVYEKALPPVSVGLEAVGGAFGFLWSEMTQAEAGRWGLQTGIIAHVWLPRENEKLFLRTGVVADIFAGGKGNMLMEGTGYLIKIPLQFEYQYPKGSVRPRAAYGVNYYIPNMLTVSGGAGISFRIGKH